MSLDYLNVDGYIEIDFHGFGTRNNYTRTISLFFKRFILLSKSHKPLTPKEEGF